MRATKHGLLLLVLLAACTTARRPIDPVWGKVACSHCRMLVGDPRFAAQALTADGDRLYFDDVGCLAGWEREHPGTAATDRWVRPAQGEGWIPVSEARFAAGFRTPMDSGWAAVSTGSADTKDWSAVRDALERRSDHAK